MAANPGFLTSARSFGGQWAIHTDAMPPLRDLLLIFHAGRLVVAAQQLRRGQALPQVLARMCRLRGLPSTVGADEGHRAVERAASRLRGLGLTDTCLIRSLALATLLADRDEVQLHLGFRSSDSIEAVLSGHAWVTLDGRPLPDDSATLVDGQRCEDVAVLTAIRPVNHRDPRGKP
jgi:hypothetical protein